MKATIHFSDVTTRRKAYSLNAEYAPYVTEYRRGKCEKSKELNFPECKTSEEAAEEAFDLTNNPSRQDERELVYGRGRSLSVGDIVEVEDRHDPEKVTAWLCMSAGWKEVTVQA